MDQTTIIVCAVVGSLGVLSAILGFSAEGTKLTVRDLLETIDEFCIYPQSPALGLGVSAAIFMIIAQVIVAAVGGCYGCSKSRDIPWESKRIIGVICAVFSWIVAVIAFAMLVYGAAWNANTARYASPYGFCYLLVDGVFAGAAVLTLVATALGLTSYVLLWWHPDAASAAATAAKTGVEQPPAGISMGQPQFPQAAPPPSGEADTRVPPQPPTTTQGGDGGASTQPAAATVPLSSSCSESELRTTRAKPAVLPVSSRA